MHIIEIDDQTYRYLQSQAIAFVEKPGDTIKRLLGLTTNSLEVRESATSYYKTGERTQLYNTLEEPQAAYGQNKKSNYSSVYQRNKKKRKTNLRELVEAGRLSENQKLIFQNYRGVKFPEYKVVVAEGMLKYNDTLHSMSDLARTILKEQDENHTNDAVRGPVLWVTQEGKTIAELWDSHLAQQR